MGDVDFLIDVLKSGIIRDLWEKKWYAECLYLLAMVDYLCRENSLPLCSEYSEMRRARLGETVYPEGIMALCTVLKSEEPMNKSRAEAIPEFLCFAPLAPVGLAAPKRNSNLQNTKAMLNYICGICIYDFFHIHSLFTSIFKFCYTSLYSSDGQADTIK
jgi:hypothetical protein